MNLPSWKRLCTSEIAASLLAAAAENGDLAKEQAMRHLWKRLEKLEARLTDGSGYTRRIAESVTQEDRRRVVGVLAKAEKWTELSESDLDVIRACGPCGLVGQWPPGDDERIADVLIMAHAGLDGQVGVKRVILW
jgi:hypothetical protein